MLTENLQMQVLQEAYMGLFFSLLFYHFSNTYGRELLRKTIEMIDLKCLKQMNLIEMNTE